MDVINKYKKEFDPLKNSGEGIYSLTDREVLYYCVRELEPKTILELGPREGGTTSTILAGLTMNKTPLKDIQYFIFEKDDNWRRKTTNFLLNTYPEVNFHFYGNVINDEVINKMPPIDLLFIDANHDYILAKWYIDNLFPLTHDNSLTHIHDVFYNRNGNGWEDVCLSKSGCTHSDIISTYEHKKLYPTIYDKYAPKGMHFQQQTQVTTVTRYEEDEIRDYYLKHSEEINFFSTTSLPFRKGPNAWATGGGDPVQNCALYFWKKNANFNIGT